MTPAKAEKVKRPTVSSVGTCEEWIYFLSRWKDYVEGTNIKDKELIIQLLECCDETLRRDLTRRQGSSLTAKTEKTVLAAIRQLAVSEECLMVARSNIEPYDTGSRRDSSVVRCKITWSSWGWQVCVKMQKL